MASGYILLHKQIQENCLWGDKPFAKGQAWIDLLLMANFKDGQMMSKGMVVEIKRGQVFRTTDYLAKRWGWSRGKVLRFLKILENQKMTTLTGLPNGTLITIENYNSYQLEQTSYDTPDDTSSVQARYKPGTQKNKEKERINKNNEKDIYSDVPDELKDAFMEWAEMRKKIKKPIPSKRSVTRALNTLDKLASTTKEKIKIIEKSVDKCWTSFYELKENNSGTHQGHTGKVESGDSTDYNYPGWTDRGR